MSGKAPLYFYVFDHVMSFSKQAWGANYSFCYDAVCFETCITSVRLCARACSQVCHGEELPFVFETSELANYTMTAVESTLAHSMVCFNLPRSQALKLLAALACLQIDAWTNFAKTSNPNTPVSNPNLPSWPAFEEKQVRMHSIHSRTLS